MFTYRTVFTLVLLLGVGLSRSGAQPVSPVAPLSVDDIVKLSKQGISEDVLAAKIKKNEKAFALSADELVKLNIRGVRNSIINPLPHPTHPSFPPPPPPSPPPPKPPVLAPKPVIPPKKYPE